MKAEYVDHMGDDLAVVNAARVSFDKESSWDILSWEETADLDSNSRVLEASPVYSLKDKDTKLIRYLARCDHFTPFSHCVVKLRETVPIFVARQRFKHTVGFSYNEVSRRYVSDLPEFYAPDEWRGAPVNKKQGSTGSVNPVLYNRIKSHTTIDQAYQKLIEHSSDLYKDLIEHGVAPEQARMVLPQSMYTSYIVTGSLAAWARAYKLRSKEDAQNEIQELAAGWNSILRPLFPISWAALCD